MVCIIDMYILKPEDPIHVRVYNYICTVLRESRPYQWILRFLFSTNHKDIGTLYILWAVFASLVGSMLSLIIRTQLAVPGNTIVEDSQFYNVLITSHALIMIFFVVMPVLIGGFATGFYLCKSVLPIWLFRD
jgi:hypothetical protein